MATNCSANAFTTQASQKERNLRHPSDAEGLVIGPHHPGAAFIHKCRDRRGKRQTRQRVGSPPVESVLVCIFHDIRLICQLQAMPCLAPSRLFAYGAYRKPRFDERIQAATRLRETEGNCRVKAQLLVCLLSAAARISNHVRCYYFLKLHAWDSLLVAATQSQNR